MEEVKYEFKAISPYAIVNFVDREEKTLTQKDKLEIVTWGARNNYPDYLLSLYNEVGTLRTLINGCVDYTLGNGIVCPQLTNRQDETLEEVVWKLIKDYFVYGGCAYQVIRNKLGEPREIIYLDFRNLRSSKKGDFLFYSEDWSKSVGRCKYITIPKFRPDRPDIHESVVYLKNSFNSVYPTPLYGAETTIKACELEKEITNYHFSAIQNGFTAGFMINFNNGIPTDEQKKEIEKNILEKFSGTGNAARILINFNESKEVATELTELKTEDYGEKYKSLQDRVRQEIFTAFRATPNLFGIPTETTGFNEQEYESAFKLFNRTVIRPVQNLLVNSFKKQDIEISFEPFSLEG